MAIKFGKWKKTIILTIGLLIFLIIFEIFPRYASLYDAFFEIIRNNNAIESIETTKLQIQELNLQNKRIKFEINNLVSDYEENKNISSVISYLDKTAGENRIKISSIKPGKLIYKDNLWLQPLEVSLQSNYQSIFNFLRILENSSKVILINELTYKPDELLKNKLNFTAKLEVYLNL